MKTVSDLYWSHLCGCCEMTFASSTARTGGKGSSEECSSVLRPQRESEEDVGVLLQSGHYTLLLLLPPGLSLCHRW